MPGFPSDEGFTEAAVKLCEVLGLDPKRVASVRAEINFDYDEICSISASYRLYAEPDELKKIAECIKKVRDDGSDVS